jgi:predicted Rdx family selenoprotein
MGNYAVIGDSYAVVDKDSSHWAKIWADNNGHTVDFFGLEGGNLVNISYLFENIQIERYDGFIIHYTSALRAEGSITADEQPTKKLHTIIQLADVYTDEPKPSFKHIHPDDRSIEPFDFNCRVPKHLEPEYYYDSTPKFSLRYYNMMPHWYDSVKLTDGDTSSYDYIMTQLCNKFYDSVSIRWLLRANFLAYRNIVLNLEAKKIKNVTVFPICGGFNQTIEHVKEKYPDTKIWDQSQIMKVHPSTVESRNHMNLEHAQLLASTFSADM